jgi:pSer/pThr/pTyr-binding forkhead associated (FHA) protein
MQLLVNSGKAKGSFLKVTGPRLLIGRGPECQLRPHSDEVSQRHAELKIVAGIAVLFDLGSASGTRVNGQKLTGPASLRTGDRIEIGPLSLTALLDEAQKPKRRKRRRTTEDEIASWLIDEEDEVEEAVAPPKARRAPETTVREAQQVRRDSSVTSTSRRASNGPANDAEALELLRMMRIRPE